MTKKRQASASEKSKRVVSRVVPSSNHREHILKAAVALLTKGGRDALTTRAVAAAAHVQPPILYRLFKDKTGLLMAVAEYGFSAYMAKKRTPAATEDPVESLRIGWRLHVEFGLTKPELYLLMYADPHPGTESGAAEESHRTLTAHMRRVAMAGRLRMGEERAAYLFHAAACGIVMVLLGKTAEERDMSLSDTACNAALATIVTDQSIWPAPTAAVAATTLRALVTGNEAQPSEPKILTQAESVLLIEWLDRFANARSSDHSSASAG